jgi:hypothetical protein
MGICGKEFPVIYQSMFARIGTIPDPNAIR